MKRVLIFLFLSLLATSLKSQEEDLLQRIQAAGSRIQSMDAQLVNDNIKPKKHEVRVGKFYYQCPDKFGAYFDNGTLMVANENRLKIDIGLFHGSFKMGKSGLFRSLSNLFLYGVQGKCQALAEEHNYNLNIAETDEGIAVTLESRKKSFFKIGYEKVIFLYNSKTLLINAIKLFDSRGTKDFYRMENIYFDVPVQEDWFKT